MRFYFMLKFAVKKDQSKLIDQTIRHDPVLSLSAVVELRVVERNVRAEESKLIGVLKRVGAA